MGVFNRTETAHLRSGWVDCFRLCRALAILALGATMHLHLPALAPADSPRVAPLQLASSEVEAAERGIVVNRALIFAPQSRPPESANPARRDLPRMPLTGLLAKVRSPEPPVARPVPRIAVAEARTPFAAEPAVAPVESPPQPVALGQPDGLEESGRSYPLVGDLTRLAVAPVAGPRRNTEEELVRQLIDRYTGALERLDVGAAQAAWPTVDGKALKRAFGQLASQRLTLKSCGITISGSTANARCRGSATYQPRIGSGPVQLASREWTFDFSKQDTDWRIVNTFVR
jgi:hypothetical protein